MLVTEILGRARPRVRRDKEGAPGQAAPPVQARRSRAASEVPTYTRQLATLLKAGIPLAQALSALIEQCQTADLEACFRDIRERITQGLSFAEALAYHPAYFDDLFVNMVKAGEAAGNLDGVLDRLAEYLQRQAQIRNKVAAALTYPMVMMVIGVVIVIILMTFVVPKIMQVVEQSKQTLPLDDPHPPHGLASSSRTGGWSCVGAILGARGRPPRRSCASKEYRYGVDKLQAARSRSSATWSARPRSRASRSR